MLEVVLLILFFAAQLGGLVMIPLGLPGTFLQVAAAAALSVATARLNWLWVVVFLALALIGEGLEFLAGRWGARRFGGSSKAAWGALIGGIVGGFLGGIPIPLIGNIIMAFVGTFTGALLGEMHHQKKLTPNLQVGFGAVLGRALSVGLKLGLGLLILIISALAVLTKS